MNTLVFLGGAGVGALVAMLLFIFGLAAAFRSNAKDNKQHAKRCEELLAERSESARRVARAVEAIEAILSDK